jgi:hypothetical protein
VGVATPTPSDALGASMSTAVGRRPGTGGEIICSHAVSVLGVLVMV